MLRLRDEVTDRLQRIDKEIARVGKSWDGMADRLDRAARTMLPVSTAAAAGLTLVAKAGIEFESSFAGVRKTVDASEEQLAELAQGFRQMAREIPVSVNELNQIGEAAGQLGIKTENILEFSRTMADLGVATNMTSDEAATMLARFANVTGMARQAKPPFDRLGSTIVALGNNLATTEREIVEMALRLAGVGAQIGLTEAEILALAGALSSVGIQAEAGGTAFSRVMIRMQNAVASGTDELAIFSRVAGVDFAQAFREDAAGAVNAFIAGLARLHESGENLTPILESLELGEIRVSDALRRSGNAAQLVADAVELARGEWERNLALTTEAEQRYRTVESRLRLLNNEFYDLRLTLFEGVLPALDALMDGARALVPVARALAQAFADLPRPIQATVVGLGALAAAAAPVLWVASQIVSTSTALIGAFKASGVAARGLALVFSGTLAPAVAGLGMGFLAAKRDMEEHFDALERRLSGARGLNDLVASQEELAAAFRRVWGETGALPDFTRLTREQQRQLLDLAASAGDATQALGGLSISLETAKQGMTPTGRPTVVDELSGEVKKLMEQLSGRALEARLQNIAAAIRAIGGPSRIARGELEPLSRMLAEARQQGATLEPVLDRIAIQFEKYQLFALVAKDATQALANAMKPFQLTTLDMLVPVQKLTEGLNRLIAPMRVLRAMGPSIAPTIMKLDAPPLFAPDTVARMERASAVMQVSRQLIVDLGREMGTTGRLVTSAFSSGLSAVEQYTRALGEAARMADVVQQRHAAAAAATQLAWASATAGISLVFGAITNMRAKTQAYRAEVERLTTELERLGQVPLARTDFIAQAVAEGMNPRRAGMRSSYLEYLETQVDTLSGAMDRFGLSADDVGTSIEQLQRRVDRFLRDTQALTEGGFSLETIVAGGAEQLNELLRVAMETGQQLPEALRPFLEQLALSGQLSEDVARKMLGIADPVPWREMEDAAKRYGIQLDQLGKQFEQAKLDDTAKQLAADWKLLVDNGANVGAVIAGMSDEVRELVREALKLGLTIPESMKPVIQAMADAGALVDENGEKLADLSRIEWAPDVLSDFDRLILKIDELIDKLTLGLYPAMENIPSPKIDVPAPPTVAAPTVDWAMNPQYAGTAHTGGRVVGGRIRKHHTGTAKVLAFPNLRQDEVPAILQTGEAILNRRAASALGEQRIRAINNGNLALGGGSSVTINVYPTPGMSETQVAEMVYRRLPRRIKQGGL